MSTLDPIAIFRQEAEELLSSLERDLLSLETRQADSDLIDAVFRALHTLKGSGAMFGFTAAAAFVHQFETEFDRIRKGEGQVNTALIRVALEAKDHLEVLTASPDAVDRDGEKLLSRLRLAVGATTAADARESGTVAPLPDSPTQGWNIRFRLPADSLGLGTNPLLLLDELRQLGPCTVRAAIGQVPPLGDLDPASCHLGWEVVLSGPVAREAIDDVFLFVRDGMDLTVEPLAEAHAQIPAEPAVRSPAPEKAAAAEPQSDRAAAARPQQSPVATLRVPADRLDSLMDRVGELVIAQARLTQLAATSRDPNLLSVAEDMARLSASLRDTTMGIRMIPIGTLFTRFQRMVRDLSQELGKEIAFTTSGEETELDKTVIDQLADPLVHLIRNAVDHGLEVPDRRTRSGKATAGQLRLSAQHAGAEVAISISDDGAGLNAERIRAKAIEAGLIQADAQLSEQDLYRLIFKPGFSTASQVTSLSGRGVGMDVVKRTIDGLRGNIDIASRPNAGTTVSLRLPLTLAIIDGLLVRVGNERYTIPLVAVQECVELPQDADAAAKGRSFLNIRGGLVPFMRLRELFGAADEPDPHQKVVIVASGETRVGLVVDQIIGNNQTVIKQLPRLHTGLKSFSGATILGDGTVALILDVMNLVDQSPQAGDHPALGRAA